MLRYRFIGDTILTVPFLRNLRRAEPEAYIAWVVAPGTAAVVQGIPYVDELIFWDPPTIHADSRGTHKTLADKLGFIRELRNRHFDTVYVLKRSFGSALMALLSGASSRIGFATEGRGFLLTKRVSYRHDQHEVQNFLDVLRADGVPVTDDYLESWPTDEENATVDTLLTSAGVAPGARLLAVHPFASIVQRGWHHDDFVALMRELQCDGLVPVILGGDRDHDEAAAMAAQLDGPHVNLAGRCSIRQTMALLQRCSLFVGNDSGIMHLAAAAGVPLVALFGPQSPLKFGPWGRRTTVIYHAFPCSPCRQKFFTECAPSARQKPACIEAITVAEVLAVCRQTLAGTGGGQ